MVHYHSNIKVTNATTLHMDIGNIRNENTQEHKKTKLELATLMLNRMKTLQCPNPREIVQRSLERVSLTKDNDKQ